MISSLRNFAKTKFAALLVFIMIIPFVFWGMGGMFSSGNTNNIAKINNNSISTEDFIDYINKSGIPEKTIRENLEQNIIEEILSGLVSTTLLDLEIKDFDQKAVILNPGGFLNLDQSKIINERKKKHSQSDIENYLEEIKTMRMAYEDIKVTFDKLLFKKLLEEAAVNAEIKSEMSSKYNFIFELVNESDEIILRLVLKTNPQEVFSIQSGADISFTNYSAIKIDYRYFYGLLTSKYHWNNAIVGSQFFTKREPIHDFRRDVQSYLYYLTTKRKHHANQ